MKRRSIAGGTILAILVSVHCGGTTGGATNDGGTVSAPLDASERESAVADANSDTNDEDAGPFTLTSTAFTNSGTLPSLYTCDGAGTSPPLAWTGAPKGTTSFALLMTTLAKDGLKWNWVLYDIPATTTALAEGSTNVGTAGITSDGPNLSYSPPCSQGPGAKTYTFTLYALSAKPTLPAQPNQVTGAVLTDAIATTTLASSAVNVTYTR